MMPATGRIAEKYADTEYPDSDGKPVGETEFHVTATFHLFGALRQYFINSDNIYVAAGMFLYYTEKDSQVATKTRM